MRERNVCRLLDVCNNATAICVAIETEIIFDLNILFLPDNLSDVFASQFADEAIRAE